MTKEPIKFQATKASELPLNGRQLDLLALVGDAGEAGAIVYGRGPTETVHALQARQLVECIVGGAVQVIVLGKIERRSLWRLTAKGKASLGA